MNTYFVMFLDETGTEWCTEVDVPDLVENITEWVREEYPESTVTHIEFVRETP